MIKAVVFDLNGIFTRGPKFSERLNERFRIPMDSILPVLKEVNRKAREAGIKYYDAWIPALKKWKIEMTFDEFMDLWLGAEVEVPEMLDLARRVHEKGRKIFILANDYKERAEYRRKHLPELDEKLEKIMDGVYYSWNTGFAKPDVKAFENLLNKNDLNANECLYFDDSEKNVKVATGLGFSAYLETDVKKIEEVVKQSFKKKVKYPAVVDFRITSECNYNCLYCFGPKGIRSLPLTEVKRIIKRFHENGCTRIVVSGGEPLLRGDIQQILEFIHSLGMDISLSTTGVLFFKYADSIDRCVQFIGLPLDYDSEEFTYRKPGALGDGIDVLEYYQGKRSRPVIKIGTVCTKDNFNKLHDIGRYLSKFAGTVDLWKVYQFIPNWKNGFLNREILEISSEEFTKATEGLVEKFSKFFRVLIAPREANLSAYFLVNPNGDVFIPGDDGVECSEISIGNLVSDDWDDLIARWSDLVSMENYSGNIQKTYIKN